MGHGGKRLNAGRKRGSRNRASAWREEFFAQTGPAPVQVMLDAMRRHHRVAEQEDRKNHPNRRLANSAWAAGVDVAAKVAVYIHPRAIVIDNSPTFDWSKLSEKEIVDVERALAKAVEGGRAEKDPSTAIQYLGKRGAEDGS